jgi:hypothetical protein
MELGNKTIGEALELIRCSTDSHAPEFMARLVHKARVSLAVVYRKSVVQSFARESGHDVLIMEWETCN